MEIISEINKENSTWKKSYERLRFPKIAGSSEFSATGTPLLSRTGNGCIGIEDVRRWRKISFRIALESQLTIRRTRISFEIGQTSTAIPLSLQVFIK